MNAPIKIVDSPKYKAKLMYVTVSHLKELKEQYGCTTIKQIQKKIKEQTNKKVKIQLVNYRKLLELHRDHSETYY